MDSTRVNSNNDHIMLAISNINWKLINGICHLSDDRTKLSYYFSVDGYCQTAGITYVFDPKSKNPLYHYYYGGIEVADTVLMPKPIDPKIVKDDYMNMLHELEYFKW